MDAQSIKVACSSCNLRELCLPMGLNEAEMDKLDHIQKVWTKANEAKAISDRELAGLRATLGSAGGSRR